MNPLVSICVPVYNVQPYIRRCLLSLIEQTYKPVEIILADDASDDGTLAEIAQFRLQYPDAPIRLITNQAHHGSPFTRRQSILAAQGAYIVCVDSDDRLMPCAVEHLLLKALETHADIVCGQIEDIPVKGKPTIWGDYQPTDHLPLIDAISNRFGSLAGKLFRRSLFTGSYSFAPDGMDYGEDRIVCLDKLTYAGNIRTLDPIMENERFMFSKTDICDREAIYELFEREKPDIITPPRKRRIAAGSGRPVEEVNRLIKQLEQTQKMMRDRKSVV